MFNKNVYFYFVIFCFALFSNCFAGQDSAYIEDELVVKFAPKANGNQRSHAERSQVLDSFQIGKINKSSRLVPGLTLIKLHENGKVEEAISKLHGKNEILYVEPNYKIWPDRTPHDAYFSQLWGLNSTTPLVDINAPEAWEWNTSSNVVVAVIDSGTDYQHPDLAANMWQGSDGWHGYDFVTWDNDPIDDYLHGTHVAGIIGAVGNNYQGVTGVCWNAQIMSLKFIGMYGYGSDYAAISAIEFAIDHGAKIINASWGDEYYTQGLHDAIEAADANGVLFVASAGNNSEDDDVNPHYPASYDCENIISVMATNNAGQQASYSSYGPTSVDLAAPGGEYLKDPGAILSTFPTYWTYAMNRNIMGYYSYHFWNNNYERISGTSMATPYVTGACALVWTAHPELTHLQVKAAIMDSVDPISQLDGRCVSGGKLNVARALYSADGGPIYLSFVDNFAAVLRPHDPVTYKIAYHYNYLQYTQVQNDVVLTAQLPAEVLHTGVTVTDGGTYNPATHTVTWNLGSVGPGDSGSVTVSAKVGDTIPAADSITCTAAITNPSSAETSVNLTTPWYRVRIVGRGWFDSIGAAIEAAMWGDTIEVFPGTYYETIYYNGKALTIRGSDPNDPNTVAATIIDAADYADVVTFLSNDQGTGRVLQGLTLRNSVYHGASGVFCDGGSSPLITQCILENNWTGVSCYSSSPAIEKCIIRNNFDTGILIDADAAPLIRNNIIYNNGIGIHTGGNSIIINNTVANNLVAGIAGFGVYDQPVRNCILWRNSDNWNCSITYSCISDSEYSDGDTDEGNIYIDPLFVNSAQGDYHIGYNSPCINAGAPGSGSYYAGSKDFDNESRISHGNCDIGADEVNHINRVHIIGGGWYESISSAISAAIDGNEIEVLPEIYYENITFNCKAITVRGSDPNNWDVVAATIIDGNNSGNVVGFYCNTCSTSTALEGLTVRNSGASIRRRFRL